MPNESYLFRTANTNEVQNLQHLAMEAYWPYAPLLSDEGRQKLYTSLSQVSVFENLLQQSTCFVCEHQGNLVGSAYLVSSGHPWDVFEADWAYIRMVGVLPAHSGKGIAKQLTKLCVEEAKRNQEKILALHTSELMDAARHIYESLGFKQVREIPLRLGKRYWLYHLDLVD
jgi:ribosomal protein S18 acetylase RimI-like enzyme